MRSNGENILKTLLARSPNLAYQRRYSSSSSSLPPTHRGGGAPANRIQLTPSRWLHPSLDMPRPPLLPSTGMYQYPLGATNTGGGGEFPSQSNAGNEQLQLLLNQMPLGQQQGPAMLSETSLIRNDSISNNSLDSSFDANSFTSPDSAPLMTTPTFDMGGVSPRKPHPRRYELCRYFMLGGGQCPFGEKCWFVHPDGKNRDIGGATPPTLPQVWHPAGFLMDQYGQPHPPQTTGNSQNTWPYNRPPNTAGGSGGGFLPMVRPGAFPAQGGGGMMFRPYILPGQFFNRPMGGVPMGFPPQQFIQSVTDPVLRFKLLSELQVGVAPSGTHLLEATQLSVRADHFYLSLNETLRDYRILFGGDRSYSDSSNLSAEQTFAYKVTCLHCSRMQTLLVVIGLENGSIYCWDPRKNNSSSSNNSGNTQLTTVHESTKVIN